MGHPNSLAAGNDKFVISSVEAPCFSRGKLDFSPAEKRAILNGLYRLRQKAEKSAKTFPQWLKPIKFSTTTTVRSKNPDL